MYSSHHRARKVQTSLRTARAFTASIHKVCIKLYRKRLTKRPLFPLDTSAWAFIRGKTCLKWSLKNRQTKILMTNGSLMKVESIAECSTWSILQYFWPAFLKTNFGLRFEWPLRTGSAVWDNTKISCAGPPKISRSQNVAYLLHQEEHSLHARMQKIPSGWGEGFWQSCFL